MYLVKSADSSGRCSIHSKAAIQLSTACAIFGAGVRPTTFHSVVSTIPCDITLDRGDISFIKIANNNLNMIEASIELNLTSV